MVPPTKQSNDPSAVVGAQDKSAAKSSEIANSKIVLFETFFITLLLVI
jgi:hypothetical protein